MILFLFQNPLTAKYAKTPSVKRRKGRKENELTPAPLYFVKRGAYVSFFHSKEGNLLLDFL